MLQRELRDLAHVPRWGIARTIRTQSVAEHSYFVAIYTGWLGEQLVMPQLECLDMVAWALIHDIDESFMSDIPGPSKRNVIDPDKAARYINEEVYSRFEFYPDERPPQFKDIIKCADLIDECMYLAGEMQMGNRSVTGFYDSAYERLQLSMAKIELNAGAHVKVCQAIEFQMRGQSKPPRNNDDVGS